jgi:hypothetical protein
MRLGTYSKLGRIVQQPNENIRRLVKYNQWLEEGERITDVSVSISPTTDPAFVINNIVIGPDSDRFAYYASGGVDGEDYTATVTITTSAGQTREDELLFGVKEISRG